MNNSHHLSAKEWINNNRKKRLSKHIKIPNKTNIKIKSFYEFPRKMIQDGLNLQNTLPEMIFRRIN